MPRARMTAVPVRAGFRGQNRPAAERGTVYKGKHRHTGEVVAVKVIAPGPGRTPVMLQRFEREFQAAKVLDHPNVVKGLEYCGTGPHPFLVMEYVDGDSLGQRVDRDGP